MTSRLACLVAGVLIGISVIAAARSVIVTWALIQS